MIAFDQIKTLGAVLISVAIGASFGPGLNGCSDQSAQMETALASLGFDFYRLSERGRREIGRFSAVFQEYAADPENTRQLKHFRDAYKRISDAYVDDLPDGKLIEAAVQGVKAQNPKPHSLPAAQLVEFALDAMTAALDPHSAYLNPEELHESELVTSGEFGGLGIQITQQDGLIKVIAPIEGTPAERAGIKTGDLITHIDGVSVRGMSLKDAVNTMRGQPGTKVELTLQRDGRSPMRISVGRAIITIEPVRWFVEGDIAYTRVVGFNEKAAQRLEEALSDLRAHHPHLAGLVLDLRNNPGGLLDQSVAIADAFLENGLIVKIRGRQAASERGFPAEPGDLVAGLPIVVLINAGSASAAEIVAAALGDNGRATVMGSTSFGKGSVQTIMRLPEGGALKLTTALYYSPSGSQIQARGITPRIQLLPAKDKDAEQEPHEVDLPGALPARDPVRQMAETSVDTQMCPPVGPTKDREIGCAMAYLKAGSTDRFLAAIKAQPRL